MYYNDFYYNILVHQISFGRLIRSKCCILKELCFQEDDIRKNWCYKRFCEELMGANLSIFGRVLVAVAPTNSHTEAFLPGPQCGCHRPFLLPGSDTEPWYLSVAVRLIFGGFSYSWTLNTVGRGTWGPILDPIPGWTKKGAFKPALFRCCVY